MKIKQLAFYFLLLAFLASCSSDDNSKPSGAYSSGIFIVNEGNFGSGNSSVSHLNPTTATIENGIFQKVNSFALGDVAQSMHIDGDNAYIVVNNSNKVEVVEYGTFTSLSTVNTNLANPRYMVTSNNKGYVSNWGNFDSNFQLDQSYVGVYDLRNNSLLKKINTQNGSENLLISGNRLFVSNNFTNTLQVIDLTSETIVATIEVSSGPGQIIEDKSGAIWVVCAGSWGGNNGEIVGINKGNLSISRRVALGLNPNGKITYDPAQDYIYYSASKNIYRYKVGNSTPDANPFLTITDFIGIYGIGFHNVANQLYVSDAIGFAGNGTVRRYSVAGSMIDEYRAGIGPSSFVFIP